MTRQLVLSVPDEVYVHLQEKARQSGVTPEELAMHWIVVAAVGAYDPLEEVIGSIRSQVPDWPERHDEYLGKAILEDL